LPVTITFAEFKTLLSGVNLNADRRGTYHIDRIDATKGYELANLRVLSASKNVAKGNRERLTPEYGRAKQQRIAEKEGNLWQYWY
jgi:hypothetical protein